jgi:hypothetical protein
MNAPTGVVVHAVDLDSVRVSDSKAVAAPTPMANVVTMTTATILRAGIGLSLSEWSSTVDDPDARYRPSIKRA